MYDYRKMTPEERAEVIASRRAREYPLHAPPRGIHEEGHYLITAACFEHTLIFDDPALLSYLQDEVMGSLVDAGNNCFAWSFMPIHYHVLLHALNKHAVSETLRKTHSRIATHINGQQHTRGRKVWCEFTDRNMRSDHHYWASVNYIHMNAVKHQFVDDINNWPWSSWPLFCEKLGEEWVTELQQAYPLYNYGKGWDW